MQLGLKSELKTVLKLVMEKRKIVKIRVSNRREREAQDETISSVYRGWYFSFNCSW